MFAGVSRNADDIWLWFVLPCANKFGLLTRGNIAMEVSCGCNDIILLAAMGIP